MAVMTIGEYRKPKSSQEAYELLISKKSSALIGGGTYLHLSPRNIGLAVDLVDAGLDYIRETDETIEIGAMTSLRELETNEKLSGYFDNMISRSVENIVGVQFRNMATVGATVHAKYGFSDLITGLRALDTKVVLTGAGELSLDEFMEDRRKKDLLEKIVIKKESRRASFQMMRNSIADYAILNASASVCGDDIKISVGARPGAATYAESAMDYLRKNGLSRDTAHTAAEMAAEELVFGTNTLGTSDYRKHICYALVVKALTEVI